MNTVKMRKKAQIDSELCVACGCCTKVCPMAAIAVWKGLYAKVQEEACVGCGKCIKECPASVIRIREVQI